MLPRNVVKPWSLFVLLGALAPAGAAAQGPARLTGAQARERVGSVVTVCGPVASARYDREADGQPTFLNLDEPYPNQSLVVVIPGSARNRFGEPETTLLGREICARGMVEELTPPGGLFRIVVIHESHIEVTPEEER